MFSCKLNILFLTSSAVVILFLFLSFHSDQKDIFSPCSFRGLSGSITPLQKSSRKTSENITFRTSGNTDASLCHPVSPELICFNPSFLKSRTVGILNTSRQKEGLLQYSYSKICKKRIHFSTKLFML